jgi:hypothetical protein
MEREEMKKKRKELSRKFLQKPSDDVETAKTFQWKKYQYCLERKVNSSHEMTKRTALKGMKSSGNFWHQNNFVLTYQAGNLENRL